MTDNDIIKALECCIGDCEGKNCFNCPLYEVDDCQQQLNENALDLITRQQAIVEKSEKVEYFADKTIATLQAENERLKVENQSLRGAANSLKMHYEEAQEKINSLKIFREYAKKRASDYRTMRDKYLNAKSEAVKEFAEKLKELDDYDNHTFDDCVSLLVSEEYKKGRYEKTNEIWSTIDNLAKEMVGENNE